MMIKRIFRFLVGLILVLSPFAPITENLFLKVGKEDLLSYVFAGTCIASGMVLLVVWLQKGRGFDDQLDKLPVWLCFIIGVLVLFPLHLGPPRENSELLQHLAVERFRYVMLLLAILLFAVANYSMLVLLGMQAGVMGRILTILILSAALINFWDNYDSLTFGSQMNAWVAAGNDADNFFARYDYHIELRAFGRALLYVISGILCVLLWRTKKIRSWQAGILVVFCLAGVIFCLLSTLKGPLYYFPFMVPAIALAPVYWTGLALMITKMNNSSPV